jgi:uncharacterized protein (TIGR04551 family)
VKRALLIALGVIVSVTPARADGNGYADLGQELLLRRFASPREKTEIDLGGYFRMRGESLYNLDLDHGLTPSGDPLFPVPVADPTAQSLHNADTRLRTDLRIYPKGAGMAITVRVDVLDNLALGSTPEGKPATGRAPNPAGSPGQNPPAEAMRIKRAFGEALLPIGVLAAGRMGAHWGLGLLANGGDCEGCDGGDAADRIAFVTPIAGHHWAVSFDLTATGPVTRRKDQARAIDIEPSDDVRTVTFAVFRQRSESSRLRRRRAGVASIEYGAYLSHRWQDNDIPSDYLPTAAPVPIDAGQVMHRGYRATAVDAFARFTFPSLEVAVEAAYLNARVDQPSLIPGVLLDRPVTSNQVGMAVTSRYGAEEARFTAGFDFGYASGDDAPGFGAFPEPGATEAMPGDLDGPQASLPADSTVDNFRFHPDYRIDRILFREIIGTVTDAIYLRPHMRYTLLDLGHGRLTADVALIASWAAEAASTPGGARALGVEIDPGLRYETKDGFRVALEHGLFLPGAGFDVRGGGPGANPAQMVRVRMGYYF